MAFKIGFSAPHAENQQIETCYAFEEQMPQARRSVVQVFFEGYNTRLSYFNDKFDLQIGDLVFVEGKFEGVQGRVVEINYSFKIKLSDYKRVVAVADRDVRGEFYTADSHFVSFDRAALSPQKAASWFFPPMRENDYAVGEGYERFDLCDLNGLKVSPAIFERGLNYYRENKVRYLCIDGTKGYAIVDGTEPYEVEFEYENGAVGNITCSCACCCNCKHEVAAMLQLKDILQFIEEQHEAEYRRSGYFSAVFSGTLIIYAIMTKKNGKIIL